MQNSQNVHIGNITYVTGPIHIVHTDGGNVGSLNQTVASEGSKITLDIANELKNSSKPSSKSFKYDGKKAFADEHESEREESNKPDIYVENIHSSIDGRVLKIVNRRRWLAQPPVDVVDELELPVSYVVICMYSIKSFRCLVLI